MARINNHDRSSDSSTGDLHSVSDPTADINGTNPSSNNNNISAAVRTHQEDSRTKKEDGGVAVCNNTKTLATDHEKEDQKDWLRLGIGSDTAKLRGCTGNNNNNGRDPAAEEVRSDQGLLGLSLFSSSATAAEAADVGTSRVFHAPPPHPNHRSMVTRGESFYYHQRMFRPPPLTLHHYPSFLSSPGMPMTGRNNFGPSLGVNTIINRASSDLRVGCPPRRPCSGIWFVLRASQIQAKEPFLPQVNKSYLRIKDGSVTVRLLIKYLMNKLQLDSESEIEIRCRGQRLLPILTIQHVRDTIWRPSSSSPSSSSSSSPSSFTLLPESTTDHVMILHYGRSP
ncbi:PREDICTED: uncharacterized protein LOC104814204 [Tarenaya hassleriana]|uniref:uncharacterized protein LOC104814204 n=1 Tax=Tarenaya hassleriana TaxID=28532 RepID=UPI00053C2850|nr:PREDICTED: uncharacterized protein LOC104814204 [Tarenaya hassleriana]